MIMQKYKQPQITTWKENFDARQKTTINAALNYDSQFSAAGLPGHNLIIIISQLAHILDQYEKTIQVLADLDLAVQVNQPGEIAVAQRMFEQAKLVSEIQT